MNFLKTPSWVRGVAVGLMIASTACVQVEAASSNKVVIGLAGKQFGNGKSIKKTSDPWTIFPSTTYYYKITGQWKGTGTLANALPPGTSIAAFLEAVKLGSSSYLSGQFDNPTGTLPATVLQKSINGSRNIKGLGKVKVTLTLKILIDADGLVTFSVSNMKVTGPTGAKIPGSVRFGKGTKLKLSTKPI